MQMRYKRALQVFLLRRINGDELVGLTSNPGIFV